MTSISPFIRRFFQYSFVGVGTYLLDLLLIYLFRTYLNFPDALAVALGFLIAVSVNFLISYLWVFRGTEQTRVRGYLFFLIIATVGLGIIVTGTLTVRSLLGVDIYLARTIVAGVVGILNYGFNALFNFKMLD